MRPVQARFITACQQLLTLGVVLAFLTPASGVISLDIVGQSPDPAPGGRPAGAPLAGALRSATVPTGTVEPEVTEVPLTTTGGDARALAGRTVVGGSLTSSRVTSKPQDVTGYGAVGVTWAHGEELVEDAITVDVRTRTGDTWSDWAPVEYHDDHGPDPASAEAAQARPGTEPLIVGDVDAVQVRAAADGSLPDDLSLAVIEPGAADDSETEAPAIETEAPATEAPATEAPAAEEPADDTSYDDEFEERAGDIALRAASRRVAAQPTIFSRAQWGADESIRNKSALRYGSVSAGFVHHTVNANDYTEDQVPGILRSIYAYHVKSRGWSDIGYNFLVDRFGRIWEGRYGGIDKNVVGAHTLGYNDYAFAMSAIGNFDVVAPPEVMLQSYGALFAWKLGLNGVNPASSAQKVGRSTFAAISGHRDAGKTVCPGKYLYAQIPTIRTLAAGAAPVAPAPPPPPPPVEIGDPAPQSNLVGEAYPDLVVRRAADGQGMILPTGGLSAFGQKLTVSSKGWKNRQDVLVTPDVTGDGVIDLISTSSSGVLRIRPGVGNGRFKATSKTIKRTRDHTLMTAVGDINNDGRNDLVARHKGRLVALYGAKKGGFGHTVLDKGFGNYTQLVGAGDQNGDGLPDLIARDLNGRLLLHPGNGKGGFGARVVVAGSWSGYASYAGGADYNGDGRPDLVARTRKGSVFIIPSRGDGTFAPALGPTTNVRSLRSLTGVGNISGTSAPDLIGVKGNSLVIVPNRGTYEFGAPIDTGASFADADRILNAGDWNRDGSGDVITRSTDGNLWLYPGNGTGQLGARVALGSGFGGIGELSAVGDVTGDGFPDLLGIPSGGALTLYAGTGTAISAGRVVTGRTMARPGLPVDLAPYDWVVGVSDIHARGRGDYVVRQRDTGYLFLFSGTKSGVATPRFLGEGLGAFDLAG